MYANVGAHKLYYEVHGDAGPWVVLSHSLACDHTMWDPQIPLLAKHYRVLAYDTRGHGKSDVPPGPYTLDDLAADVIGVMDTVGVERAHLVGLSMGGMTAQHAALMAPERFLSLVLADTSARIPPELRPMWEQRMATAREQGMAALEAGTLERWFTAGYRASNPGPVAAIGELIRSTPVDGYVGCSHGISHLDVLDRIGSITCPVLVIVGAEDAGTPVAWHEAIHAAIPHSKYVVLQDAAHLSNIEQAAAFDAALMPFLAAASGA